MKFCIQCGGKLVPQANFCAECGTPCAAASQGSLFTEAPPTDQVTLPVVAFAASPAVPSPIAASLPVSMFDPVPGEPGWRAAAPMSVPPAPAPAEPFLNAPRVHDGAQQVPNPDAPHRWNPLPAAIWSGFLTVTFGGILCAKNWAKLGEEERKNKSLYWAYGYAALLAVSFMLDVLVKNNGWDRLWLFMFSGYWVAWMVCDVNPQLKYIKENLPQGYVKKKWGKPLGLGFAGVLVGMMMVGILLAATE